MTTSPERELLSLNGGAVIVSRGDRGDGRRLPLSRLHAGLSVVRAVCLWLAVVMLLWICSIISLVTGHSALALSTGAGVVVVVVVVVLRAVEAGVVAQQSMGVELMRFQELARARASQISYVAHEIRTPLALVNGAAALLLEQTPGPLTDEQREFVEIIGSNCDGVVEIAKGLLAQARAEASLFDLRIGLVNLRRVVLDTVRDMRRLHGIPIMLNIPGPPPHIFADPRLIRQALTNLITNSVRAASAANVVTVVVHVQTSQDAVLISVSDDGPGMSLERRRTLFDAFATGHGESGGTGLGMVITRQIVELHGGRIMVDTMVTRGTTVRVVLPRSGAYANGR